MALEKELASLTNELKRLEQEKVELITKVEGLDVLDAEIKILKTDKIELENIIKTLPTYTFALFIFKHSHLLSKSAQEISIT